MSLVRGALIAFMVSGLMETASNAQTPPDGVLTSTAVDARPLATLDLFSAGARSTGLPTTIWKGASADLAHRVFGGLGQQMIEPGLALLARDVLETAAGAPDGAGADADLAGDRVLSLIRLGDFDGARAILARTPGVAARPRLSQAAADLALWTGDPDRACGVADALSEGRDARYWLELRAFCLIRAGKPDQAQLALDFAAQSGARNRQLQQMLATAQGLHSETQIPGQASNALAFMVSRFSKADVSGAIGSAPTPALIALSTDETQLPEIRRRAAFRLLSSGASATEAIRSALQTPVAPPKAANPPPPGRHKSHRADTSPGEDLADSLARDYQAAAGASTNPERAGALLRLFRAVHGPAFRSLCDVAAPELALITTDGLNTPDRALLALAASVVDAPSTASLREGLSAAEGVTEVDLALLDAAHELAAIEPKSPHAAGALMKASSHASGPEMTRGQTAAVLMAALNGPSSPMPASDRAALATFRAGPAANAAAILSAQNAVASGAAGEVALLTLDAASDKGLAPADRALLVHALSRAGLERNARSIALDGLLTLAGR